MAPLNNVKVRQAMEYAIDKTSIAKLTGGLSQIANQPLPPGIKAQVRNLALDVFFALNGCGKTQVFVTDGRQDYPDAVQSSVHGYYISPSLRDSL